MQSPGFHFITAVWGQQYTKLYAEVVLPTQLSAGNLGGFVDRHDGDAYWIYTTAADRQILEASPAYATLERLIRVRWGMIDDLFDDKPKHSVLTEVHKRSIEAGFAAQAAMVFLCPDAIWSDGSFTRLPELIEQGKRVVMMPGIRVSKETFVPEFLDAFAEDEVACRATPPRPLTSLGLKHLHQISETLLWDTELLNPHMSHLYFPVRHQSQLLGIAARCFHLHPLMVYPKKFDSRFASTIDGDFVPRACPDPTAVHVVANSDEMVVFELSDITMNIPPQWPAEERLEATRRWMHLFADHYHRGYVKKPLRIHGGMVSADAWAAAEKQAATVIATVMRSKLPVGPALAKTAAFMKPAGRVVTPLVRVSHGTRVAMKQRVPHGAVAGFVRRLPCRTAVFAVAHRVRRLRFALQQRYFQWDARFRANRTQWIAHVRRWWWIISARVNNAIFRLDQRRRDVGLLRILGVRSKLRRWLGSNDSASQVNS